MISICNLRITSPSTLQFDALRAATFHLPVVDPEWVGHVLEACGAAGRPERIVRTVCRRSSYFGHTDLHCDDCEVNWPIVWTVHVGGDFAQGGPFHLSLWKEVDFVSHATTFEHLIREPEPQGLLVMGHILNKNPKQADAIVSGIREDVTKLGHASGLEVLNWPAVFPDELDGRRLGTPPKAWLVRIVRDQGADPDDIRKMEAAHQILRRHGIPDHRYR